MSEQSGDSIERERRFFYSLLGALTGVGLISLSVYLGAKDDFLAVLFTQGGDPFEYAWGLLIGAILLAGIVLIGRHILTEDSAHGYCEQTPY